MDGAVSDLQPVQVSEVCNITDNESSVSSIHDHDLMIQSPTVECHTPIFIDSSSNEASFPATFSPCDEPGQSDNSQHSTTAIPCYPSSTGTGTTCTVSTLTVTGTTVTSSSSISEGQSCDIAQTPAFPPTHPVNMKFPTTTFGNTSRSFNPVWYDRFDWLEHSVKHDAYFCYPCRMFGSASGSSSGCSRPEPVFTSTGFSDWKHATGKSGTITRHSNCYSHKQAEIAWGQYKLNSKEGTTIAERMGSARSVTISQNRHYIRTIAEVLLLCSRQEIALHGHRESNDSTNRGNFLELLNLIAQHDSVVKYRLKNGPKNATYTSPEIQNSILHIMASIIQEKSAQLLNKLVYIPY